MKRRRFLAASSAGALGFGTARSVAAAPAVPAAPTVTLAGYSLAGLCDLYRADLFDDYIPFHDKYVVDHALGGFMVAVDRDGTPVNTDKGTWYLGRGTWTYSYLYNNIDRNPKHLEAARKAVEFTLARKPEGDSLWPATFSKDGKPIAPPDRRFGSDLFIALGLGEFSKSPGNARYFDIAKEIILKVVRV